MMQQQKRKITLRPRSLSFGHAVTGALNYPALSLPNGEGVSDHFKSVVEGRLRELLSNDESDLSQLKSGDYRTRLDQEMEALDRFGFLTYFINASDIALNCPQDINVPRRMADWGQSVVAYILGISPVLQLGTVPMDPHQAVLPFLTLGYSGSRLPALLKYCESHYGLGHVALAADFEMEPRISGLILTRSDIGTSSHVMGTRFGVPLIEGNELSLFLDHGLVAIRLFIQGEIPLDESTPLELPQPQNV
jgi:hypothetical protein